MKLSVCLAAYNGAPYLRRQVASILPQLPPDAEVLISDDGSSDATPALLSSLAAEDGRIRLLQGPGRGVVANFNYLLSEAKGDVVFLSDQDDVWHADKVASVLQALEEHPACGLVLHDAAVVDGEGRLLQPSFFRFRGVKHGLWRELWKNSYTGCCLAVTRSFLQEALPVPEDVEMHDWWLGLLAERKGNSFFLDRPLIDYCRHEGTATSLKPYPLPRQLKNRAVLLRRLLQRKRT